MSMWLSIVLHFLSFTLICDVCVCVLPPGPSVLPCPPPRWATLRPPRAPWPRLWPPSHPPQCCSMGRSTEHWCACRAYPTTPASRTSSASSRATRWAFSLFFKCIIYFWVWLSLVTLFVLYISFSLVWQNLQVPSLWNRSPVFPPIFFFFFPPAFPPSVWTCCLVIVVDGIGCTPRYFDDLCQSRPSADSYTVAVCQTGWLEHQATELSFPFLRSSPCCSPPLLQCGKPRTAQAGE